MASIDIERAWLYLPGALVAWWVISCIHAIFFHPLSSFPGPISWIITGFPIARSLRKGNFIYDLQRMHDKYGPVVRFSTNELSFSDAQAWQDIYGHHGGDKNFPRDPRFYLPAPNGTHTILSAGNEDHGRMRRLLAHAFSDRALKGQEHFLQIYIDLLMDRLSKRAVQGAVNIKDYFVYTTFDIAGELEFGESFDCLEKEEYHYWLAVMLAHFKRLVLLSSYLKIAPFLTKIAPYLIPKSIREQRMARFQFSQGKVGKRLAVGDDPRRPDFMTYVCRHNDEKGMKREEIDATFDILVTAGSETTASTLTGTLHFLLQNPAKMERLKQEVRQMFKHDSEINMTSTATLPYLTAVIQEGLRLAPATPTMLPRLVPDGGADVCGHQLPAKTSVGVSQYVIFRSEANFAQADTFIPERWLSPENGGAQMVPHEARAFMPFSNGPRNCLGKSLAWSEIRMILSTLLWTFDVERDGKDFAWEEQKTFVMWEKKASMVKLTKVKR